MEDGLETRVFEKFTGQWRRMGPPVAATWHEKKYPSRLRATSVTTKFLPSRLRRAVAFTHSPSASRSRSLAVSQLCALGSSVTHTYALRIVSSDSDPTVPRVRESAPVQSVGSLKAKLRPGIPRRGRELGSSPVVLLFTVLLPFFAHLKTRILLCDDTIAPPDPCPCGRLPREPSALPAVAVPQPPSASHSVIHSSSPN